LIFTTLYAGSNIQNSSEQFAWLIHLSFLNFALHPTPQKKKNPTELLLAFKQLYVGKM
jgi:hypothetical protein